MFTHVEVTILFPFTELSSCEHAPDILKGYKHTALDAIHSELWMCNRKQIILKQLGCEKRQLLVRADVPSYVSFLRRFYKSLRNKKPMNTSVTITSGVPLPLGAHLREGGVNFAVFSRHATQVWLRLFPDPHKDSSGTTITLDPLTHRTGDVWHVWVKGVRPGWAYTFSADGPDQPDLGHRFQPQHLLLDPRATAVMHGALNGWSWALDSQGSDAQRTTAKCLVNESAFDWQGDRPLKRPWTEMVIYETHVRSLTIHPSSSVTHPGSFLGLIEKIPYLKALGITAVELMPVQEFNPYELTRENPKTGERLRNFWGYNTIAFYAPCEWYGTQRSPDCQVTEFKTMVRELHRAGIEVILDVVFNHTAEGDETGPTLHFRGLENGIYYLLESDRRRYHNYSGCGNTVNCNHPVVRSFIRDCLRYWVIDMHVDGFRFDLASILGRDTQGNLHANPPLLESISEDPVLRHVKLIAEAWDAGGAYQVGSFPGTRWSEWNGHYRDDIRRFWRGDPEMTRALATRLCGSADLYLHTGETPVNSVNFITCHDGFTLNDLVSYNTKHNAANGEDNRDGTTDNYSFNYGVEGPTDDPAIDTLRTRQIKNMLATLLVSRGVPMILGGDEFRRTQRGNNNAYCQDNDVSWYDWTFLERYRDLCRFVQGMIAFRARHPVLSREQFYESQDVDWFTPTGFAPDWHNIDRTLGWRIHAHGEGGQGLCLLFNAGFEVIEFQLPAPRVGTIWRGAVDTAAPPPADIYEPGSGPRVDHSERVRVTERSLVILVEEQMP